MLVRTERRGGKERRANNVCCMMSGATCRTPRTIAPTYTTAFVTGERHWRSLPRSTHCSHIFSPAQFMLDGQRKLCNYNLRSHHYGEGPVKLLTLGRPGKLLAFAFTNVAVSIKHRPLSYSTLFYSNNIRRESTIYYSDHPRRLF